MTFENVLIARGRAVEIPEESDAYGWLIGSWDLDCSYLTSGHEERTKGEVHFAWVLNGRAVQDVWIMPGVNNWGTTLRIWDPAIQAWRVTWNNPPTGRRNELIGRRSGKNIVQIGTHPDGRAIRWIFTDISSSSFRWTGEVLESDGKTWRLESEFHARRKES